jgi:GT2 family glycosyltransferase
VENLTAVEGVALIIPNWNGRPHLEVCLSSVARQTVRPLHTIVVDNGSTDDSGAFIRSRFPWVECLTLDRNWGFAAAVNRGIGASAEPYVALLNNDTELDAGWMEIMLRALDTDRSAGMAACKMLRFDDRRIIDSAGDAFTRGGSPVTRGAGEIDRGQYDRPEYVPGTCAGAALYRRELFDRIGVFDEEFVSYYEDVDLSLRAQLAGYQCIYVPSAICFHKRGATAGRLAHFPARMQERNLTAVQIKNFPAGVWMRKGPVIILSRIRRLARECRTDARGAALGGFLQGLGMIPRLLRKRRRTLALSAVSSSRILSLFGS